MQSSFEPQYLFPNVVKYNGHLCICYVKIVYFTIPNDYIRQYIGKRNTNAQSTYDVYIIAVEIFKATTAQQQNIHNI